MTTPQTQTTNQDASTSASGARQPPTPPIPIPTAGSPKKVEAWPANTAVSNNANQVVIANNDSLRVRPGIWELKPTKVVEAKCMHPDDNVASGFQGLLSLL